jgi:hypothetical protein
VQSLLEDKEIARVILQKFPEVKQKIEIGNKNGQIGDKPQEK